jgi:hypothetical protein
MSAHRTHYTQGQGGRRHTWRSILAGLAIACVLGSIAFAVSHDRAPMGPVASPVLMYQARAVPLQPLDGQQLAEIRIEAFRAGYDNAVQDGCRTVLASPTGLHP